MTAAPKPQNARPLGVAVIAVFLVLDGALVLLQLGVDSAMSTRMSTLLRISDLAPAGFVVLAALRLVAAVGLWRGSRWAWVLAMLLVGIGLLVSLYLYALDDPSYPRLAIDVVMAFYLNQGAVRDYFEDRAGGRPIATATAAPAPTPDDRPGARGPDDDGSAAT
jgi:uncharacterized membrane protein (DUF2068 family)